MVGVKNGRMRVKERGGTGRGEVGGWGERRWKSWEKGGGREGGRVPAAAQLHQFR